MAETKVAPCIYCLKEETMVFNGGNGNDEFFWVVCTKHNCGAEGPMKRTKLQAIAIWNKMFKECNK